MCRRRPSTWRWPSDIAPIDVARAFPNPVVLVVDPSPGSGVTSIRNGLESLMRAMEICHLRHAELRMKEADLVIRPEFDRSIDVLDFDARAECIEAGVRAVIRNRSLLHELLRSAPNQQRGRLGVG